VLTRIIWQMAGYHSALNFSQVQSFTYCPFRPAGMREPLRKLTAYHHDLKEYYDGHWLKYNKDKEVCDVSNLFIQESLPTNAQMFGMILIANVLTSRTVQTLTNWMTPFAELHSGESTDKSKEAFEKFKRRVLEIE